ncbi:pentatricopeptide repeat-containing protein At1g31430 [Amborella trichopoda]|uniref:pentatricopeptide repeat-containing protein At1g31430 n=1 Tax=Amborella trichopoda TaxID=13333 RepID=UPI0005D3DEBC|nr:pentatricopeptide repeat-containing protein At1g31430 [Amborella trichopoda]|eukprot:XP_011629221.1 pentatricopeptide repeat-containing protein At1g31430 [Amborella trichopoda]
MKPFQSSLVPSKAITRLTKQACVALLENCKSMKELKQIHCQLYRIGLDQNKDIVNKLMASNSRDLPYAEKIFCQIKNPHLFIYNIMVRSFAKHGNFKKIMFLYHQMREEGIFPDNFTYPFVLKAMGYLQAFVEGEKAHVSIIKRGFEFECYVRNSLVEMYSSLKCIDKARILFDETPKRDVISWNVMLSCYVKTGSFSEAANLFRLMEQDHIEPDEATLVTVISACVYLRNLDLGKNIHSYMEHDEKLRHSISLSNALIDMYSKCGCITAARVLFDGMREKTVISWTAMIHGYVNCGDLDNARMLFDRIQERDTVLWTAMINGYARFSRFNEALELFQAMQISKLKPDKFTIVTILTVCAHLGALEQGKWIHNYIKENQVGIDAFVGTALVDMYAKCGSIEESFEAFLSIQNKDTAAWTAMICALAMHGQTSRALDLFSEMRDRGTRPDDITFIGILSACSRGGLVEEGKKLFALMEREYGIEPKVEHYGCMVDLLGRADLLVEAQALIEKMPIASDTPLWGALLSACRIHGNVEMGEWIEKLMPEIECHNSGLHTLVANIYAAVNRWDDVNKVRREMKDLGIKKVPGCSSIEVNGVVHEFIVGDTSHPQMRYIYSLLDAMVGSLEKKAEQRNEREDLIKL